MRLTNLSAWGCLQPSKLALLAATRHEQLVMKYQTSPGARGEAVATMETELLSRSSTPLALQMSQRSWERGASRVFPCLASSPRQTSPAWASTRSGARIKITAALRSRRPPAATPVPSLGCRCHTQAPRVRARCLASFANEIDFTLLVTPLRTRKTSPPPHTPSQCMRGITLAPISHAPLVASPRTWQLPALAVLAAAALAASSAALVCRASSSCLPL